MNLPTDVIEYDDDQFRVSYEEWLVCDSCGTTWQVTSPDNPDENYREEPQGNTTCPECGTIEGHAYEKRHEFYIKQTWWFEDPQPDVDVHVDAFRHQAKRFEALDANGWEMTRSTGEHVTFEQVEDASIDGEGSSEYRVDDTLE